MGITGNIVLKINAHVDTVLFLHSNPESLRLGGAEGFNPAQILALLVNTDEDLRNNPRLI